MSFRQRGSFHVRVADAGGTFGVLELPERRVRVYRAIDGALVIDSHAGADVERREPRDGTTGHRPRGGRDFTIPFYEAVS
jgi:hypothetical protein